jgi:hypothetical protein
MIGVVRQSKNDPPRYHKGTKEYIQSVALNPNNHEALENLQDIKLILGKVRKALEYNLTFLKILEFLMING